ncbi:MAG: FAD-dependent oxidoreductase, partial [Candidatus Aureabacteria bacterium]|nr:FAD-dependent oxidoreductase [Candidatus Auribacterota bacterium]
KNAVTKEPYDLVVLSVGLEPPPSLRDLAGALGVPLGEEGFVGTEGYDAQSAQRAGIFVCGAAGEPKDIPESVAQASAAAAKAAELLSSAKGSLTSPKIYPAEREIGEEEPRVGVFICRCGINIGGVVDVPAVVEYAKTLPSVAYAEENLYTCSQDTQQRLKEVILREKLNRILVASCTPRTHEVLFQDTLKEAGLNPFLFEFVGIREQCSWVHMRQTLEAGEKAKDLVAMGVARARRLQPVSLASFPVVKEALVIGGGAAGMTAALSLAEQGFKTHLVEKEKELGGNARRIRFDLDGRDPQAFLEGLITAVEKHPKIVVHRGTVPVKVGGYIGNFSTTLRGPGGKEIEVAHGAIVVATGAEEYQPREYLYGVSKNVVTQKELEERLGKGEAFDKVAMIQCVGSRDTERPYCSRVCCLTAVKNALKIKETNPRAEVYILYRDMRTYGFSEVHYQEAREAGVVFLRYEEDRKPEVREKDGKIRVKFYNYLLEREVELEASTLVLSAGIVMPPDVSDLSQMLKVPLTADRMFLEAHAKLRPLDFSSDGIYLCGLAHGPKTLRESVSQGLGAAARAATLLSRSEIQARARPASLKERTCSGCGLCVEICPFDARELDAETGKAKVIEVLCQGCGACLVACPNASSRQEGFEKAQVLAMIDEAT